jgi:trigger factor
LNIEVETLEGCKRQLNIQIPGSLVNDEISRAGAEMARYARVPGFRPGRVPMSVIKNRYKAELRQEALRSLLPSAVETAVEMHRLRVVGEPQVEKLDFADDGALDLAVVVEVAPEFELGDYKGLELTKRVYTVGDEDVDAILGRMREEAAQLVAVDEEERESRDGDFVSVDLEGEYVDEGGEHEGHHHEPIKADDVSIEIGGANVQPEFSENLRGLKVGDTKTFRVEYPAENAAPSFAGHTIEYTARVAAIRVRELPELDDAFASEAGDYESLDDLRKAIREDLEKRAEAKTEGEIRDSAIDALLAANEFAVPEVMMREQAQNRVQGLIRSLSSEGLDPRGLSLDWASMRDSAMEHAERDVRAMFIVDRIARTEQIDPSDDEVEAEIARIAESVGQPLEQVKARLTKEGGADSIRDQLRTRKALDFVIDAAHVTTEQVDGLKAATGDDEPPAEDEEGAAAGE